MSVWWSERRVSARDASIPEPTTGSEKTRSLWPASDHQTYREAWGSLQRAIRRAQKRAWDKLLANLCVLTERY